jgi:hypothetical protein
MIELKSRKAQGSIFGMSFGMIVSIILIVFFVAAAFMGIRAFLNYQKCATIGMFLDDLQSRVDEAWYAESASYNFTSTLPGGIDYVCFLNMSSPMKNANDQEKGIYQELMNGAIQDYSKNFYLHAPSKDYCIKWKTIKHVDLSQKNPICARVSGGKVKIQITRDYSSNLVRVSE